MNSTTFIVLGMHKSGTTLVSKILHDSGISMGNFDETVTYDQGNQYERSGVQSINEKILGKVGAHSLNIYAISDLDDQERDKDIICKFLESNQEPIDWGIKEPRLSLTYQYWLPHIKEKKVIVIFRLPISVWNHYRKDFPRWKVISRFFRGVNALRTWASYNQSLLEIDSKPENIFISYDLLIGSEDEFLRLESFVGRQLNDCRDPKLVRSSTKPINFFWLTKLVVKMFFNIDVGCIEKAIEKKLALG